MGVHDKHRMRTRAEFLEHPESFPDHRVLEVLLFYAFAQGDTNPLAHTLLEHFGSVAGVLDASYDELCKVSGVGDRTAVLMKVSKELSRRYLAARTNVDDIINSIDDAHRALRPYFFGANCEMAFVLCMDGKKKRLGVRKVGEGSADSVHISPRSVSEAALSLNCSRLILAHNHVSGLAFPSADDKNVTRYLSEVLDALEIQLDDHLIFVDDDMVSMRDSGMMAF